MKRIEFSNSYRKSLKKLSKQKPDLVIKIIEKILIFNNDINHPALSLHKLSGTLKDHWAFSIEKDIRIIFRYTDIGNILFIDIGTHDQVY